VRGIVLRYICIMTAIKSTRIRGVFNCQPYVIDYSLPAMQVYENLPVRFPAEVIDNRLYVSPLPNLYHADLCGRLSDELKAHVVLHDLGDVWSTGLAVHLEPGRNVVGPDIIFVSKGNKLLREHNRGLFGVPDLLVEILSTNRKYDLTIKKNLYERAGVKEVWYVNPVTKNAQGYLLENGKYGKPFLAISEIHIRILNTVMKF
jgi:Uma2 family endonuclease